MKKLLGLALLLILLVGCGTSNAAEKTGSNPTKHEAVDNLDGVTMTIKEGTISAEGLTLVLENNSDKDYIYGEPYTLEKKIDDDWYQVKIIEDNYGFIDIGYVLNAATTSEWTVDWEWLYGSLDEGEYRIVKDILDTEQPGEVVTYYLTAEFTIE